jgi:hypothetical protein
MKAKDLMPNSCWTCKHDVTYRWSVGRRIDEDVCMLSGKTILMDDKPWKKRMAWCPLDEPVSDTDELERKEDVSR